MKEDFPQLKYNSHNEELRNFANQKYQELKQRQQQVQFVDADISDIEIPEYRNG